MFSLGGQLGAELEVTSCLHQLCKRAGKFYSKCQNNTKVFFRNVIRPHKILSEISKFTVFDAEYFLDPTIALKKGIEK